MSMTGPAWRPVRAASDIPIAAGESEFTRFDFRDLLEHQAVDYFQPDLASRAASPRPCGSRRWPRARHQARAPPLGRRAQLRRRAPGHGGLARSSHANIPSAPIRCSTILPRRASRVVDGMIAIPDRPGLGVTIDEEFLAAHTVE